MAERYYIARIVGQGTEGDPYRAKPGDAANVQRVSACIATDEQGQPRFAWALCRVIATDFSAVEAMSGVFQLGSRADLDRALTSTQKAAIKVILQEWQENIGATDIRVRDLITRLIRRHYPYVNDVLEAFP